MSGLETATDRPRWAWRKQTAIQKSLKCCGAARQSEAICVKLRERNIKVMGVPGDYMIQEECER